MAINSKPSSLAKFRDWLASLTWIQKVWLLAPIMIWFSYLPKISLGSNNTMNFELSLTLIYITVLALVGLPAIWRKRQLIVKNGYVWLVTDFVIWSLITVIWSPNQPRAILTAGVTGVLWLIFLASYAERKKIRKILPALVNILITSAVIASLLAIGQMILGTFISSRSQTGLCAGCMAIQFGFVRPNLFAIEPQFFGSLLLAPALIILHRLFTNKRTLKNSLIFILLVMTLGLTLSRGAIYAFIIGALIMTVSVGKNWLHKLATVDLMILAGIGCLLIQGSLAAVNPTVSESFWGAISKSINHLSMGVIDIKVKETANTSLSIPHSSVNEQKPAYDGYVAESTDIRVNLTKTALLTWSNQPLLKRIVGTGLGSAGIKMAEQTGSWYKKEIVQNEYIEALLERGIVGILLLLAVIISTFYKLSPNKWLWAILATYLLQYCFFSGLPNVLHVYLVVILFGTLAGQNLPSSLK